MENKSVKKLYNEAKKSMQNGKWKIAKDLTFEIIKEEPEYLPGWTLLFIIEVRESVMSSTEALKNYEVNDIPFDILEKQATEKKVLAFKSNFINQLKKKFDVE
ncbi:MAG: hypothetical protein EU543_01395 [Promethearchaeota archaeon]|nr:MAG: hypothetical protein EU543_01395 [Candidatus Lokiarchaeota archaeon]